MAKRPLGIPRLAVACAPVVRSVANKQYSASDYEVCLLQLHGDPAWAFPNACIDYDVDPLKAAFTEVEKQTTVKGCKGYALSVEGAPGEDEHTVTIFYVIPATLQSSTCTQAHFQSLADVLENKDGLYSMPPGHREMAFTLDQWLRERHTLPIVNLDILFLCNSEEKGIGGLVKAIIDNPIYENRIRSPEDELIIAINNPLYVFGAAPMPTE
ncbi:hypothetical protein EMCRGX_G019527 [Ephydatia muelleri]